MIGPGVHVRWTTINTNHHYAATDRARVWDLDRNQIAHSWRGALWGAGSRVAGVPFLSKSKLVGMRERLKSVERSLIYSKQSKKRASATEHLAMGINILCSRLDMATATSYPCTHDERHDGWAYAIRKMRIHAHQEAIGNNNQQR